MLNPSIILTLYIAMKPLYIFSSGSMQIADFFLVLMFICLLISKKLTIRIEKNAVITLGALCVVITYQILVNIVWSVILE